MERATLSLDGAWDFHFSGDARIALRDVERWRPCTVPAPWQAVFPDLRQRNGRAWYRRTFELPAEWLGGAVFLRFGAVNYHAQVLVNRTPVTEHEGGWLPFEAEIGAYNAAVDTATIRPPAGKLPKRRPRSAISSAPSSRPNTPATQAAEYWPTLWPNTTSGSKPHDCQRRAKPISTANKAGWA